MSFAPLYRKDQGNSSTCGGRSAAARPDGYSTTRANWSKSSTCLWALRRDVSGNWGCGCRAHVLGCCLVMPRARETAMEDQTVPTTMHEVSRSLRSKKWRVDSRPSALSHAIPRHEFLVIVSLRSRLACFMEREWVTSSGPGLRREKQTYDQKGPQVAIEKRSHQILDSSKLAAIFASNEEKRCTMEAKPPLDASLHNFFRERSGVGWHFASI